MHAIYQLPFAILTVAAAAVCLAIPRLRRYAAPVAFGLMTFPVCSIVSMFAIVLGADYTGIADVLGRDQPVTGVRGVAMFTLIYILPGIGGAIAAAVATQKIQRRVFRTL